MGTNKVIFHGGCLPCNSQQKYGRTRCAGCQYFEPNWNLPDLSIIETISIEKLHLAAEDMLNALIGIDKAISNPLKYWNLSESKACQQVKAAIKKATE